MESYIYVAARLRPDCLQLRAEFRLLHAPHQSADLPQRVQILFGGGESTALMRGRRYYFRSNSTYSPIPV